MTPNDIKKNKDMNSVSANDLLKPVNKVTIPQPAVATMSSDGMVKAVAQDTQNFITAQSAESKQLNDLRKQQASFAGESSLGDLFTSQQDQYQIPQNVKTLQDIQLQLADRGTQNELQKSQIESSAGQTIGQAQREVTQQDRESAIRDAGLAARAAVLQGNIETASSLVNQAIQTTYQDRTLRNTNMTNQINSLQGVVDNQTAQLLEKEKRQYTEDQAAIQRVQDAVDTAMNSGAATEADIKTLTDPNISDEQRLTAAQAIVSRGQTEMRNLDVQSKQASIRASDALTNERYYNSLVTRAGSGDASAISELGLATDSVDNVGIYGELANSKGGKPLPASAIVSLEKAATVANQLGTLGAMFQDDKRLRGLTDENGNAIGIDLAPITKIFRSNNPYDVKAQQITASINAIVPNLARGIYGEVGVLTDTDVTRYAQTIPNLGSITEVQDAMLALTLKTVKNSVQNKLVINARNGADVSGQVATLEALEKTVGKAMLPLNQKTPEYNALISGGASKEEIDSLLLQGYELDQVISYYTGQ